MAKNKIFGALLFGSSCFLASCATTGTISGVEVTETHFGQHEMVVENKRISKIISPVYQSSNSAKEITNKATQCVESHLENNIIDVRGGGVVNIGSNAVIRRVSERNGALYATHTVDFNFALLGHMAQADFMLEAKDGKFRVTQANLKQIQKNSGSVANSGFIDVVKVAGTSWNNVMLALINAEKKVVDCIRSENKSDW